MDYLQNFIHRLEVGGGMRYLRIALGVLAFLVLLGGYNWRAFRNLSTQEAMDAAQLGRNIAEGKGYTTLFVRPLSMHLIKKRHQETQAVPQPGQIADFSEIRGTHPDIANPPVYPWVLAGLMKVLPFRYAVATDKPFWTFGGRFWRHQPDFLIAVFNELLFLGGVVFVFFIARRLFDRNVAWLSALLVLGTELFWQFSVSGLSTMLLLLLFLGLVWCIISIEQESREPRGGAWRLLVLAGVAGVLVGVGALTRYAFGWLVAPLLLYLILITGRQRVAAAAIALVAFVVVLGPWVYRNYSISGEPFGTATYTVLEGTGLFPEHKLQRSLEPDFSGLALGYFWHKLLTNGRQILQTELPKMGGTWVTALFLAGLLVNYGQGAVQRLRYFLLAALGVLILAQALGKTQLSEDSPGINSENLLILAAPLVIIYGVSLFFLLLDQLRLPFRELRYGVIGLFAAVACLPLGMAFLPPKTVPVVYPPYSPPGIQIISGYMKENELTMSDIPWAVAWYGQRQCVWLTLNAQSDFFAINDFQKAVQALYLTPVTMNNRSLTGWIRPGAQGWDGFVIGTLLNKEPPPNFPLRKLQGGWLPEQLFLSDWERWNKPETQADSGSAKSSP